MKLARAAIAIATVVGPLTAPVTAAGPGKQELDRRFQRDVRPFLNTYCVDCHGSSKQEAMLDLTLDASQHDYSNGHQTWEIVRERLEAGEMPPEEAKRHPKASDRRAVVEWIQAYRKYAALQHAGDPGTVLARRLSNAEYNYTIRDLTGVDIRPTQTFPVDPANKAGFDNSGESLAMSPA